LMGSEAYARLVKVKMFSLQAAPQPTFRKPRKVGQPQFDFPKNSH
jgi:hypothetical protein